MSARGNEFGSYSSFLNRPNRIHIFFLRRARYRSYTGQFKFGPLGEKGQRGEN